MGPVNAYYSSQRTLEWERIFVFLAKSRHKYVLVKSAANQRRVSLLSTASHTVQGAFCIRRALHVRGIIVALGGVATRQDSRDRHCRRKLGVERSSRARSSSTGVAVLSKDDVAGTLVAGVPHLPSGSVDDRSHARLLEDDAGVLSPGTAEVVRAVGNRVARGCSDVAVVEDVVGRVRRRVTAVGYWSC